MPKKTTKLSTPQTNNFFLTKGENTSKRSRIVFQSHDLSGDLPLFSGGWMGFSTYSGKSSFIFNSSAYPDRFGILDTPQIATVDSSCSWWARDVFISYAFVSYHVVWPHEITSNSTAAVLAIPRLTKRSSCETNQPSNCWLSWCSGYPKKKSNHLQIGHHFPEWSDRKLPWIWREIGLFYVIFSSGELDIFV